MNREYRSFEEIDKDLKILRLRREIAVENLKLSYKGARKSIYPSQLMGGFSGIAKKLIFSFLLKKVLKRITR